MRRAPVSTSTLDRLRATTVLGWLEQPDAVTVIDVRSPAEFETAHIAGSYNVPLDLLGEHAAQLAARLDREVVLVCQSGARAAQARERLAGVGAEHLHVLDGGVGAYAAAGGDIVRGRARWALERQVRLVAGARGRRRCGQLAGPGGESAGGRVGAGLALSALTDICTMARVLSALPHNRAPRQRTAAEILDQLPAAPTTT